MIVAVFAPGSRSELRGQQEAAVGQSDPGAKARGGGRASQRGIEDDGGGAVEADRQRPGGGLEPDRVLADAGDAAGDFVAVGQQHAIRLSGGIGHAVQERLAALPVAGQLEHQSGHLFQRQLNAAEQVRLGGEVLLVGRRRLGQEQSAVGQHDGRTPSRLDARAPANQIGRREDPPRLAGRERQLPVGVHGGKFGRKRLAVDRHGDGRLGPGEETAARRISSAAPLTPCGKGGTPKGGTP